jgi:thiol-disulfide isomerase/thioredoxin
MNSKHLLTALLLLCASMMAQANSYAALKSFIPGSYQQILNDRANQGFMLVIWSLDCSTCIKDMELLSSIHKSRPNVKIILLSTDELAASQQIVKLLEKYQLADLESWVFADDNTQKLRYEIDPGWYSELPRTYFYSSSHQREGISGALKTEDYNNRLNKLGL